MFGLVVMAVIAVYLVVSLTVVLWARSWARKRSFSPARAGWLAALLMYLLVAWEQIPTYLVHKFLCVTKAGLHVYVTPEQWDKENSGAVKNLSWIKKGVKREVLSEGIERFHVSDRLVWDVARKENFILPLRVYEYSLVDLNNETVLVKSVAIGSGYPSIGVGGKNSWKIWVGTEQCGPRLGEEKQGYKEYWRSKHDSTSEQNS